MRAPTIPDSQQYYCIITSFVKGTKRFKTASGDAGTGTGIGTANGTGTGTAGGAT